MWKIADPKYLNKIKIPLVKVNLVTLFDDTDSEEFLKKKLPLSKNFNDTRVEESAKKRIEMKVA